MNIPISPEDVMQTKRPTAGIILAAGMSTRMGKTKQLLEVGGQTLLARVVAPALASELEKVVLVLGHEATTIAESLGAFFTDQRLSIVINEDYRAGMAGSLQKGLAMVQANFPSVMFLLGDQPFLDAAIINLLLHRFRKSDKDICVPVGGTRQGNPVIFSSKFYEQIFRIEGDTGAREIVRSHPQDVLFVEIGDPRSFIDIDSEEDAKAFFPLP